MMDIYLLEEMSTQLPLSFHKIMCPSGLNSFLLRNQFIMFYSYVTKVMCKTLTLSGAFLPSMTGNILSRSLLSALPLFSQP